MNDLDERIRAALHAAVDGLQEHDLRPVEAPRAPARRRRAVRWVAPLLASAAVVVAAVVAVAVTRSPTVSHQPGHVSPSPSPTASGPGYNCYFDFAPRYVCNVPAGYVGYEPLWPFADYQQAKAWEGTDGGHSPWHLDAGQTALLFVTQYLGFADVDRVMSSDITANEARIGVGYLLPNHQPHTAAVIHLVRFAPVFGDTSAPWEVVGARSSGFSVGSPANGTLVSSPMRVGGRITGTDENITVAIRNLSGAVHRAAPVPAGGEHAPWSSTVSFTERGVLTVVASTGGHLTAHERFAVTGVLSSGG